MKDGPLVGRNATQALLDAQLDNGPLVTLIGPAGVGKSKLARAQPRALYLSVSDVTDPARIRPRIRTALGLDAGAQLGVALATHDEPLLVIDGFDRLMPAGLQVVTSLIGELPNLRVLLTSRVRPPWNFACVEVPPLEPFEALELLGLQSSKDALALCARLDHLPLTLELAATWLTSMTAGELLSLLDAGLSVGEDTLTAALTWTWSQLDISAQSALTRASMFVSPFGLGAASRVLADSPSEAVSALRALVACSLVQRQLVAGESRYSLLTVVRDFAAAQSSAEVRASAVRAHSALFGTGAPTARDAVPDLLVSVHPPAAFAEIRAAWSRTEGMHELTLGLVSGMHLVGTMTGAIEEHQAMIRRAGQSADALALTEVRPVLELLAAQAAWGWGQPETIELFAHIARDGPPLLAALAVAWSWAWHADPDAAFAAAFAGVEDAQWARLFLVNAQTLSWMRQGRFADASAALGDALATSHRLEEQGLVAILAASLGGAAFEAGDLETAHNSYALSAKHARFEMEHVRLRGWLQMVAAQTNNDPRTDRSLIEIADRLRAFGVCGWSGKFRCRAGLSLAARGRFTEATAALSIGISELVAVERMALATRARGWLAAALILAGQLEEAKIRLDEAVGPIPPLEIQQIALYRAALAAQPLPPASGWAGVIRSALLGLDGSAPPGRLLEHQIARQVGDALSIGRMVLRFVGRLAVFPGGERLDTIRKPTIGRLLLALVAQHAAAPGVTIGAEALIAEVWPGERILASSARHRLHATVSNLRRAGLGAALETTEAGYHLLSALRVVHGSDS